MKSSDVMKSKLAPKGILIIFFLVAYEILKLFPFVDSVLLGYRVVDWLHLILSLSIIGILVTAFSGLQDFIDALLSEILKDKYDKWSGPKKKSWQSFVHNSLVVILLLIAYQIVSRDMTVFLGRTAFDTILRILILLGGLGYVYKAYQDLKDFLDKK